MRPPEDWFFDSCESGVRIHVREWPCEGEPRAILQIEHGVSEHIGRYTGFAQFLSQNGIIAVGDDHLGHGESIPGGTQGFFSENDGWNKIVHDAHRLTELLREKYPGVPIVLFGHSMGSFLARTYLIDYKEPLAGAVICGTGYQPLYMTKTGRTMARIEKKRLGEKGVSSILNGLCFGPYNKPFKPLRTESDWLSRDDALVDAYIADPLCGFPSTDGLIYDMLGGIEYICRPSNIAKMDKQMPVFLISGDNDPVGAMGKGVKKVAALFEKEGINFKMKLYPGARHELLNETNRDEVMRDILDFINAAIE